MASNIHESVRRTYDIELDKKKLLWGSVAPDILPQLKIHRHYEKESLDFVVNEIAKLIFLSRFVNLDGKLDPIVNKYISKKIGMISHFLSDFVCLPHFERWTFAGSMFKHMSYESKLNRYAKYHDFKRNVIDVDDVDIFQDKNINIKEIIKSYIENVIEEYSINEGFKNDLDFSLSLNIKISYFIIDTIKVYNEAMKKEFAFDF
ncbi:zinc dependent phospholipase C family protein [Anaerosalibacter bizertensis]|uniref:zinc dependent phospholipase C family protein n=1 Tax=Anaerosalibacter bizertensis TaxID=932217 RepID=UPI002DDBA39E|nr:zinc dependent phospholipase C family protein [Anaerosalibacter bizertensis]